MKNKILKSEIKSWLFERNRKKKKSKQRKMLLLSFVCLYTVLVIIFLFVFEEAIKQIFFIVMSFLFFLCLTPIFWMLPFGHIEEPKEEEINVFFENEKINEEEKVEEAIVV